MGNFDAIVALQASQAEAAEHAAPDAGRRERRPHKPASGQGDPEIKAMLAEVDLLAVIQRDAGEQGHASGERIDFRECPVCGHRDCFSYYPASNSWSCFGASNATGYDGGTALEYFKATRTDDDAEAVKWLRDETGHPYAPDPKPGVADGRSAADGVGGDGFPPITQSRPTDPPRRAPVLIEGILRKGHTLLVTARSKAGKTFLMLQLAVAVACGLPWLGRRCERGRVLFVNPEVDPRSAENRLHDVAEAMGADLGTVRANVDFWHLRGHAQGIDDTARALFARAKRGEYELVILDSVYELYTGDENSADDAREFFHGIDRVSKHLGCAVAMTHHHAKGARSDLDALDRGSGSGVFGRKPDAPLDLIQVFPPTDDDALGDGVTVWRVSDSGLREFPAMKPFDVFFKYPRHIPVADGATDGWKPRSAQQGAGRASGGVRKAQAEADRLRAETRIASYFIRNGIGAEGVGITQLARDVFGVSRTEGVRSIVDKSETFGTCNPTPNRCNVVPIVPPTEYGAAGPPPSGLGSG